MNSSVDYDVGIIGGGPAGAALGAYLAMAGVSCAIFEKESFPRPHVGESLVPSSTRVFRELGFLGKMEEHKFPRKYGAVWTADQSPLRYKHDWSGLEGLGDADIDFAERKQPGTDLPYTYHVDRGKFDELLLEHAASLGAVVFQRAPIKRAEFSDSGVLLHGQISKGAKPIKVNIVVDASGRNTLLANQLRIKVRDKVFDQFAAHTWFEGFDRTSTSAASNLADYIYVHFLPISNSWVWQIPISDTITSIGIVTQKKNFAGSRAELDDFFWKNIASRKGLYDGLRSAKQIRPIKAEGDYSYAAKQIAGDRYLLVGDAGRFVDPIFSTGVSIALNSARLASADIITACKSGAFGRSSFATFEKTVQRGAKNWYDFISVYYRLNVLFTTFISDDRYRLDILKLLQGDVYDEDDPAVLQKMKSVVRDVEGNPNHPWHALLGTLTADAFKPNYVDA